MWCATGDHTQHASPTAYGVIGLAKRDHCTALRAVTGLETEQPAYAARMIVNSHIHPKPWEQATSLYIDRYIPSTHFLYVLQASPIDFANSVHLGGTHAYSNLVALIGPLVSDILCKSQQHCKQRPRATFHLHQAVHYACTHQSPDTCLQ